jgi:glutathione S-transferase
MYQLIGFNPSPYSVKMRAIMRYRRLPFVWQSKTDAREVAVAHGLPPVIPVLMLPDGSAMNDSTPLIHELERRHPDSRSIVPDDPGMAFLAALIEDMADEWLTKCMFHYRWFYAPDRAFGTHWVVGDRMIGEPTAKVAAASQAFHDRQVSRMGIVGCTEANRPIIETSYMRVLDALQAGLPHRPYLFGSRPSLADFGLFGQLQILSVDPTPAGIMRERAPYVFTWLMRLDDASGVEGTWAPTASTPAKMVTDLLSLAGEAYLPFLAANATAIDEGRESLAVEIFGRPYAQAPFRYQAKCFRTLKGSFAALPADARTSIEPVLAAAGCLRYLA